MRSKERRYFPTQLTTYMQCPRKYQCSQDWDIRDKYRKPTVHLYLGSCVHEALERFFDISEVPVSERTYERLATLLRRCWAGVDLPPRKRSRRLDERQKVFDGDKELEASWGKKALNLLYRYYLIADRTVVPLTAEQFHETKLDSGIVLAGKIDRIDKDEDGSLRILDYKTGKPPYKTDDDSVYEEDVQLSAYAIVVRRKYKAPVSRCAMIFLAHDEEVGFTPTDERLRKKQEQIEGIVKEIEADKEFEPTENALCPWCEYREICPVGAAIEPASASGEEPDVPF